LHKRLGFHFREPPIEIDHHGHLEARLSEQFKLAIRLNQERRWS
jgi:hypothetical protein